MRQADQDREARLAEALRANLRRRKGRQRAVADGGRPGPARDAAEEAGVADDA